jgi:N-methylhydantoinase A/oxoprolinase/acetone carboxylase beta subunit
MKDPSKSRSRRRFLSQAFAYEESHDPLAEGALLRRTEENPRKVVRLDAVLPEGYRMAGLAIVEEPTATTVVPSGWRMTVGAASALVLEKEARP